MTDPALAIHVERTASPGVLRWVCRRPDLDGTPVPPSASQLERLISDGVVTSLAVRDGDLLLHVAPDTTSNVAHLHDAVVDALRIGAWLSPPEWTRVTIRKSTAPL